MDYLIVALRLVLAVFFAGMIGFEREKHKAIIKGTAGLRTHMLVALGSALLTILSFYFFEMYGAIADPGRIVSYIILGIGFLGAGTIMSYKDRVVGLTTAASIWFVAALGICIAMGLYVIAIVSTAIAVIVLELWRFEKDK